MNTENPTDLQNYYLNRLFKIINDVVNIAAGGNYIYRGEPKCYGKISSSLYRTYESILPSEKYSIEEIQDLETQRARDYIRNEDKQAFEIASELQHHGGKSNLIDFTEDYNIALYFACAKLHKDGHDEDGRIVLLERNEETIAKYQIRKAQYPANRVQAQNSLFVQPSQGFILPSDKDVKTVCIPKELKQWILIHLYRFQDISYQTLFNDLYGFLSQDALRTSEEAWQGLTLEKVFAERLPVENLADEEKQERHERTVKGHITRIENSPCEATYYEELARYYCFEMRKYDCAIETSSKAILLKPDYADAYINRGVAYSRKKDLDRAIGDLVKATQLIPQNAYPYMMLGLVYELKGDHSRAIKNHKLALELDPNNAIALEKLSHSKLSHSKGEDITIPQLSEKANYLLNQAAADLQRRVESIKLQHDGIIILTNGKDLIKEDWDRRNIPHNQRETVEAEWKSALRELVSAGYLEEIEEQPALTRFTVTKAGYELHSGQFLTKANEEMK